MEEIPWQKLVRGDDVKGHKNGFGQPEAEMIMLKMDGIRFKIRMSVLAVLGSAKERQWEWQNGVATGGVGGVKENTIRVKWTELNVNWDT